MRYLGLDLGSRTLGVSISDKSGTIARSLEIIRHNEDYDSLVPKVKEIIEEYGVDEIVLGYPKNMDNTVGYKAKLSEEFKKKLEDEIEIPVNLQDERLSTKEAQDVLIKGDISRKKRKKVIDSMAACIILETYLNKKGK